MTRTTSTNLDGAAHALSVFRGLPGGGARQYTATTFPRDPWGGCEWIIRQAQAVGYLRSSGDGYAVLDVLDENGDIVQDYVIPTATAFRWFKRKLNLAVEPSD